MVWLKNVRQYALRKRRKYYRKYRIYKSASTKGMNIRIETGGYILFPQSSAQPGFFLSTDPNSIQHSFINLVDVVKYTALYQQMVKSFSNIKLKSMRIDTYPNNFNKNANNIYFGIVRVNDGGSIGKENLIASNNAMQISPVTHSKIYFRLNKKSASFSEFESGEYSSNTFLACASDFSGTQNNFPTYVFHLSFYCYVSKSLL